MGCYTGKGGRSQQQPYEKKPSDFMVGLKYAVDAALGLMLAGAAVIAIYYSSCAPKEKPKVDHTPIEVLDDIKAD